jgi:hypothetical protein
MFEDGASLIVERAVTILTAVSLEHPIAAVPNHVWSAQRLNPHIHRMVDNVALRVDIVEPSVQMFR